LNGNEIAEARLMNRILLAYQYATLIQEK
jgi:hypothetical protein